jgi:hypothetical protein
MTPEDKKKLIDTLEATKKVLEQLAKDNILEASKKIDELKKKVANGKDIFN